MRKPSSWTILTSAERVPSKKKLVEPRVIHVGGKRYCCRVCLLSGGCALFTPVGFILPLFCAIAFLCIMCVFCVRNCLHVPCFVCLPLSLFMCHVNKMLLVVGPAFSRGPAGLLQSKQPPRVERWEMSPE